MDGIGAWRKGSTAPLPKQWNPVDKDVYLSSSISPKSGRGRTKHDYNAPFALERKQSMSAKVYSLELERDQAEAQLAQW